MRTHKPWYRASNDAWYVEINGKQVRLAKGQANEKKAYAEFYRRMAQGPGGLPKADTVKVAHVCDLFLSWSQKHHEDRSFKWYRSFLQSFCGFDRVGTLPALEVKPFHVTQWLDANPKWKTARRCATICVKRAFNWAFSEGMISENPLRSLRKPPSVSRDRILTPKEREELFAAIKDQQFRDFVFALQETGCRPSEVRKVTAENVSLEHGVWILQHHKTRKKTGQPRVIYLTEPMIELTKRLMVRNPQGPLFRGPRGNKPFSKNGVRCRFRRLRQKLPHLKGVISYTYRHSYATDALERGVPVATVAELIGHKDLRMIANHYGHLSEKRRHLQDAARKAAGYAEGPPQQKRPA